MTNIISLDHINIDFPQKNKTVLKAVKDVSLNIVKGDIYAIIGYSGAGKSTLVRVINLLQKPTSGTVEVSNTLLYKDQKQQISNKELNKKRQKIGMIFQHFNLLNETTVLDNVMFALKHSKLKDKEIKAKANHLLDLVGIADKAAAYPAQLSGGEQQRVAIARALANDPEILISDEATSALDPQNTKQILQLLKDLNKKLNLTIVLITHQIEAVKRVANKIAVMQKGEIIEKGLLRDVYVKPKKELTRQFMGGFEAIETLKALNLGDLKENDRLYQLVFSTNTITRPIIVNLYQQFKINVSILYGNIEILDNEPFGTLFVIATGSTSQQEDALTFLKKAKVEVTRIKEGDIR